MLMEKVHILLIEDDPIDVRAFKRNMRKHTISNPVTVASDGLEALAILRGTDEHPPLARPYLILLDLKLPRMDGLTFLAELRNDLTLRSSPVIVLTTSNHAQDKEVAYHYNVAAYLVKTEAVAALQEQIQLLQSYLNVVEFPSS